MQARDMYVCLFVGIEHIFNELINFMCRRDKFYHVLFMCAFKVLYNLYVCGGGCVFEFGWGWGGAIHIFPKRTHTQTQPTQTNRIRVIRNTFGKKKHSNNARTIVKQRGEARFFEKFRLIIFFGLLQREKTAKALTMNKTRKSLWLYIVTAQIKADHHIKND